MSSSDPAAIQPQARRAPPRRRALEDRAAEGGAADGSGVPIGGPEVSGRSTVAPGCAAGAPRSATGSTDSIAKFSAAGTVPAPINARNASTDCGRSCSISASARATASAIAGDSGAGTSVFAGTSGSGWLRTLAIRRSGDFTGAVPVSAR
jgi:hypothetical protein